MCLTVVSNLVFILILFILVIGWSLWFGLPRYFIRYRCYISGLGQFASLKGGSLDEYH